MIAGEGFTPPRRADLDAQATPLRFRDSYALLYAFTLLIFIPALAGIGIEAYYSYTPLYLLFMVAPPLLAMVALMLTHQRSATTLRTIGKGLLFGVLSMIGGGALFLTTSFGLALLGPAFESHEFGPLQIGVAVIMVIYALPMVMGIVDRLRRPSAGALVEAVLLLAAVAALGFIGWIVLTQQSAIIDAMRKDQSSFLVGGVMWYIPAYSLVGSVIRSLGVI